jgi:hypothetical protein
MVIIIIIIIIIVIIIVYVMEVTYPLNECLKQVFPDK